MSSLYRGKPEAACGCRGLAAKVNPIVASQTSRLQGLRSKRLIVMIFVVVTVIVALLGAGPLICEWVETCGPLWKFIKARPWLFHAYVVICWYQLCWWRRQIFDDTNYDEVVEK